MRERGSYTLAIEPGEVAKLLAPRLLDNRRTGVRIRPWNDLVAWLRLLTLPLLALVRPRLRSTTERSTTERPAP